MIRREWTGLGHEAPILRNDRARKSFELFVPDRLIRTDSNDGVGITPQVTPQVGALLVVIEGATDRATLQLALGLKDRDHFRQAYLTPALDAGLIEMTLPDKPTSRMQRYRLTELGNQIRRRLTSTTIDHDPGAADPNPKGDSK
jgi:ATP-dependent DNA helicase RecG